MEDWWGMNGAFFVLGFFIAMSFIALILLATASVGPLLAGSMLGFGALLTMIGAAASIGSLLGSVMEQIKDGQRACFMAGFLFPLWLIGFSKAPGAAGNLIKSVSQWLSGIGFVVSGSKIQECWVN